MMSEMTSQHIREMSDRRIAARFRSAARLQREHQSITWEDGTDLVNIVAIHGDRLAEALEAFAVETVESTVSAATVQAVRDMIERDPLIREALIPAEITSLAQRACRVVAADSAAEIRRLRAANEELVGALENVASTCRGFGPWARDNDADTLRTIVGKMIEPVTRAARSGQEG